MEHLGVDKTDGAVLFTKVLGFLLAGVADVVLFLYLFLRLAHVREPVRAVLPGAVFGALGFFVLKLVGGYYVQHTTTKGEATYGTFAVVVGLLLFLNLISRLVLLAVAYVVTGEGRHGTLPAMEQSWSPRHVALPEPEVPVGPVQPVPGAKQVTLAANAAAAAAGLVVAAVAVYGVRTLQSVLRR